MRIKQFLHVLFVTITLPILVSMMMFVYSNPIELPELAGALRHANNHFSPYYLELEGTGEKFFLRGDMLIDIPEGKRVMVRGQILTEYTNITQPQWHIFMKVRHVELLEPDVEAAPAREIDHE